MSYVIDSYTKLLIPFDGTDADTADQTAATGQTISLEGNACLDTAQKKFGAASLLLDRTGDYATVPDSADWYFGADPFTIDFWARAASSVGDKGFCGQYADADNYWYIAQISGNIVFKIVVAGETKASYGNGNALIQDVWTHIEVVRTGTSVYIFVNGNSSDTVTLTAISTNEVPNLAASLEIGAVSNHTVLMTGWIDELRISKGIARHTASFIPPNEASFLELF